MYDGGKIIVGLIIFLLIVTFPFYTNLGRPVTKPTPDLNTPVIKQLKVKECVESKAFMRAEHMKLLNEWRDSAIRNGNRIYINSKGKHYEISLQKTCLNCHSNKDTFCNVCHKYAGVKPYCWSCHFVREEGRG